MGFEPTRPLINTSEFNVETFTNRIEQIQSMLQNYMLLAQADYKKHANCHKGTVLQY